MLDLRQVRRGVDADERAGCVERAEDGFDGLRFGAFLQAQVDGGEDATGDGQQMWRELDIVCREAELFEQLAGVAMAEDGVRREVVGGVHEVGFGGRRLACAGDATLGVADDAVVDVDEACAKDWGEREEDGGGVAAGVGDETCVGDGFAVEFGTAVDGFLLDGRGCGGVGVVQFVDGGGFGLVQTPGSAEVDDLDAAVEPLGRPLAGVFVGQREEDEFDAGILDEIPVESDNWRLDAVCAEGELRVQEFERHEAGGGVVGDASEEDRIGSLEARVCEEQAREFAAGVAANAGDRGFESRERRVSQCGPRCGCEGLRLAFRRGR